MAWLRLYDSLVDDPKVQMLSDRAFRMLINMWCLAKRNGGRVQDNLKTLAFSLRMPENKVRDTIQALISANLIERDGDSYVPHDWDEHQYDSDNAAERMRAYRLRNKQRNAEGNEERNALRNCPVPDSDTEPDTEGSVPNGTGAGAPLPNERVTSPPPPEPHPKPSKPDPWKRVYDRGKEVFGRESGGLITKLRKLYDDKPNKVMGKIEDASGQNEPLSWINAFLWKVDDGGKLSGEYIGGVPP